MSEMELLRKRGDEERGDREDMTWKQRGCREVCM